MSTDPTSSAPSWPEIEDRLVTEIGVALDSLRDQPPDEPIAVLVLWADPYKGWYEVLADSQARNALGARARNQQMLDLIGEVAERDDAWKTALTDCRKLQAFAFDPRYGDYELADEPLHEFEIKVDDFVRSPAYEALNQGGEDGWLEGHMRYVISRALIRLVRDGAFAGLTSAPVLRIGYAYPDSGDAIIVAHVEAADAAD